eukprot:TRINITY_DN11361_c0_g4_i1.p1 TRINITY_DN11361_c0_g4~~TRINITY_DN11361_c0_g4_i1.p1  ORF type:complete len:385 (+),score=57.11 TRINITY_DN11361_c0_g4_i1:203-1357(+)
MRQWQWYSLLLCIGLSAIKFLLLSQSEGSERTAMPSRRVLITGTTGYLGSHLLEHLISQQRSTAEIALDIFHFGDNPNRGPLPRNSLVATFQGHRVDITDEKAVAETIAQFQPEVIVHCAALSNTNRCEQDPDLCRKVNVQGTVNLAQAAASLPHQAKMVVISTDWVYDGSQPMSHESSPLATGFGVYGKSKLAAEQRLAALLPDNHLVLRSALIYGPPSPWQLHLRSSIGWLVQAFYENGKAHVFKDEYRTPVSVYSLAVAIQAAIELPMDRTWRHVFVSRDDSVKDAAVMAVNVGGADRVSRFGMAQQLFAVLTAMSGHEPATALQPVLLADKGLSDKRPADVSMRTERMQRWLGVPATTLEAELQAFADQLTAERGGHGWV